MADHDAAPDPDHYAVRRTVSVTQRGPQLGHLAGVIPRAVGALRGSPGWRPLSARHDRMAHPEPAEVMHQRWGGAVYWHDGSHVGHLFSRQVQAETERFLAAVSEGK